MTTETDRLREQYALAYSATFPPSEPARKQSGESDSDYTDRWCRMYAPDMAKVVRFAEKALDYLRQGRSAAETRRLINYEIFFDGANAVVRLLLESIPPLRAALLIDDMDDKSYQSALELIVSTFRPATT